MSSIDPSATVKPNTEHVRTSPTKITTLRPRIRPNPATPKSQAGGALRKGPPRERELSLK